MVIVPDAFYLYIEKYIVGCGVIEIREDRSTRRQMFWRQMQSYRSIQIYTMGYNINMLYGTIFVPKCPVSKVRTNQKSNRSFILGAYRQ